MMLWSLLSSTALLLLGVQQAEANVYCSSGGPSISWPSSALPNIQRISLAEAGVRLILTPNNDSMVVSLQTTSPYHTAVLRMGLEGDITTPTSTDSTTTVLNCGNGAVGMTNTALDTLEGTFVASDTTIVANLPLRFDITVVVSRGAAADGDVAIVYAYEKVFLEDWMMMVSSDDIMGQTDGVDVLVVNNDDDGSVTLKFAFTEAESISAITTTFPPSYSPNADEEQFLPRSPSWKQMLFGLPAAVLTWILSWF